MTDKERKSCIRTIELLRRLAFNVHGVMDVIDAQNCEKIIEMLNKPEPHWIPVDLRNNSPEENKVVLLGIRFRDDFKYFVTSRQDYNYWTGLGREIKGELRWQPLPSPYQPEEETE